MTFNYFLRIRKAMPALFGIGLIVFLLLASTVALVAALLV
jgi:hypothetical protein